MASRTPIRSATVLVLMLAACSGSGGATPGSTFQAVPTTSTTATATAAPGVGRLVVIDADGDIVTMAPDGTQRQALTANGDVVAYRQPLWSPVGDDLVWAETSSAGFAVVVGDGTDDVSFPMPDLPFFAMWSPDGSKVGVLHNAADTTLALEVIDVVAGTTKVVAGGAPYFFAWSPEGDRILSHVGGSELRLIDTDGVTDLDATEGQFQTPLWTAAGIFHLSGGELLMQNEPEGDARAIAKVSGPGTLVASPNGTRIAVQVAGPDAPGVFAALQALAEIPTNAVVVLEPATGAIEVASGRTSFGYFWSPDGQSLLMLVSAVGEGELEWWVWRDGEITNRVGFVPEAPLVRDLLPFFDQYAQAWRPWAPDSSAFAFVGTIDGITGVWIQDLEAEAPSFLSGGDWVAWSAG